MADMKRLLNKKGWTGRDLGRIELTNMAVLFRQARNGDPQRPIVEKAQFLKMLSGIKDRQQGQIYNGYLSIHSWLCIQYNVAQTQLQQAQLQYRTLEGYITQAILAEDVFNYVERLPAIMTEKQYRDAVDAGRNRWLYGDGKERAETLAALIGRGIQYYTNRLQETPAKPNPLKAVRKKYISQPVKSKLVLGRYNEVAEEGYYTLPDGRRSDQMTAEEWQTAIMSPKLRKALDAEADNGEGTELEAVAVQRLIQRNRIIFNGGTEEEANKALERLIAPCEWHYYTDPPEDLTKWDIIETGVEEFYAMLFLGAEGSAREYQEELRDFLAEFKDAAAAIIADLEKRYFTGKDPLRPSPVEGKPPFASVSGIPLEDWGITLFPREDLYRRDVYGCKHEAEADTAVFDGNYRAIFNGVAIIRASDSMEKSPRIDKKGYYAEPVIESSLADYSLEAFFTESEDYATNVDIVESSRRLLLSSYYSLMGYNYTIDRIAAIHDVPELEIFKFNLKLLDERIDGLNDLVPALYRRIKDTNYSDQGQKERKLQVLKDFFQPIEYKALAIPETNKEEADTLIADFTAFKPENSGRFYHLVSAIPEETGEMV